MILWAGLLLVWILPVGLLSAADDPPPPPVAPSAGGNVTVTDTKNASISILEDTNSYVAIRLAPTTLEDSDSDPPNSVRILSVTGGDLLQSSSTAISLGEEGTILALSTNEYVDLLFRPEANRDTNATFQYVMVDRVTKTLNSAASTATIPITPVNDPPTITGAVAGQEVDDNQTTNLFASVVIGDIDLGGTDNLTVTITNDPAKGILFSPTAGLENPEPGEYTFTGTASEATSFIQQIGYDPVENRVPVGDSETNAFEVTVADAKFSVTNNTTTAIALSINDVPSFTGTPTDIQPVNTGDRIAPLRGAAIVDPDIVDVETRNGQLLTVNVVLTGGTLAGELVAPGFRGDTYTLNDVSAAQATAALLDLKFEAQPLPLAAPVTNGLTLIVVDASSASATNRDATIEISTPLVQTELSGTRPDQRVNDNSTISLFSAVTIQHFNAGDIQVDISLDDDAKGRLTNLGAFTRNTNSSPFTYSFTGPGDQATANIRSILFRPTENRLPGSSNETTRFTITLVEAGITSRVDQVTTVITTPVNDRPVILGISPLTTISDTETTLPFRTLVISDVDEMGNQELAVQVSLDDPAKGILVQGTNEFSSGYAVTGTPAVVTASLRTLIFDPTENRVAVGLTETAIFTVGIDDRHGGQVNNADTRVRVASVSGAPNIEVPPFQPVSLLLDQPRPFADVVISDDDTLTVTLTLDAAGKGVLSNLTVLSNAFSASASGGYTFSGSAAEATSALTNLVFHVNESFSFPANSFGETTFTIRAEDVLGNSSSRTLSITLRQVSQTWLVTSTANSGSGSLRDALAQAQPNDHISFFLTNTPAVIRLQSELVIEKNVVLNGPGADFVTLSGDSLGDGLPQVRIFRIQPEVTATIQGVTLSHGMDGFGGGAITVGENAGLILRYATIAHSQADLWGGAIDVDGGWIEADHCLFLGNETSEAFGRGGGAVSLYTDLECTFQNTTFSGNRQGASSGLGGGALYVENRDTGTELLVHVASCTFAENLDEADHGSSMRPNMVNTFILVANTIVADGQGKNLEGDETGRILSLGGNVSDDLTGSIFSIGGAPYVISIFDHPQDTVNAEVDLQPLGDHGGPTWTYPLGSASAALGAAEVDSSLPVAYQALGTDQRGFWREGNPDSGAYEVGAFKHVALNEVHFNPTNGPTYQFVEFYNTRESTSLDLDAFSLLVDGEPRHTFGSASLEPGVGLVVAASTNVTAANVPLQVSSKGGLGLDDIGSRLTLLNTNGQVVLETAYNGVFEPASSPLSGESVNLFPEFQGFVYLPHRQVPDGAGTPTSAGNDVAGDLLGVGNASPLAFDDVDQTDEDTPVNIAVLENDRERDRLDEIRVVDADTNSTLGASISIVDDPRTGASVAYDPTRSTTLQQLPLGAFTNDTFIYEIIDCCDPNNNDQDWPPPSGGFPSASVFVTVLGINDVPVAVDDDVSTRPELTTAEDAPLEFLVQSTLLHNDSDIDADDSANTLLINGIHPTATPATTLQTTSALGAEVTLEIRFNRNESRILYDPVGSHILNGLAANQPTNDTFHYSIVDRHGAVATAQVAIRVVGVNDDPTATEDLFQTDADSPLTIPTLDLLANDTDPDSDDEQNTALRLAVDSVDGLSQLGASVRLVDQTNVLYRPENAAALIALARKEVVTDTFTYVIVDEAGQTSTNLVRVEVTGINQTPLAADDTGTTAEDAILSVEAGAGLLANDIDLDVNQVPPDDALKAVALTNLLTPGGALVSVATDGSYTYDPSGSAIFNALARAVTMADSFSYTALDRSYTIANQDLFRVRADSVTNQLPVLANDITFSGTGETLTVMSVGTPSNGGTVGMDESRTGLLYTPAINFVGQESFTYAVQDGQGGFDTATVVVTVTVDTRNGILAANDDAYTVAWGTRPTLNVLANDNIRPASGSTLTILQAGPGDMGGTVTLIGAGPGNAVQYEPSPLATSFPYTETFSYDISGGGQAVSTATVSVTVTNRMAALVVNNDDFTVIAGATGTGLNVLANDRVLPGFENNLAIVDVSGSGGAGGSVTVDAENNRLLYSAPSGATDTLETFFYTIEDASGGRGTGSVTVATSQGGLFAEDDFFTVARDSKDNALRTLLNDTALPNVGQTLSITALGLDANGPNQGGTLTINPGANGLVYTPAPGFTGLETFTYEISEGSITRAEGRVTVTVVDRLGAVPVQPDVFSVRPNSRDNVLRVRANDGLLPPTGELLTVTNVSAPSRGGLARVQTVGSDTFLLYTPPADFVGEDTFTYDVRDQRGGNGSASVRVKVGGLFSQDDSFTVLSDSANNELPVRVNDPLPPATGFLRNITSVSLPDRGGTASVDPDGDRILYSPDPDFLANHPGESYPYEEVFVYVTTDDTGRAVEGRVSVQVLEAGADRDSATVNLTVVGVNDSPVVSGTGPVGPITDKETVRPFAGVTLTEVDQDGLEPLEITIDLDPSEGFLTNLGGFTRTGAGTYLFQGTAAEATSALQALVFDPIENRITVPTTENITFTLTVDDQQGDPAVVDANTTVAVTAVNDPPIISGTRAGQTVYYKLSLHPFAGVGITEVDDLTLQPLQVTVALEDPAKGRLANLSGWVQGGAGTYTLGSSADVTAAEAVAALQALEYFPTTADRVTPGNPETNRLVLTVDDRFDPPVVDDVTTVVALHPFIQKLLAGDGEGGDSFGHAVSVWRDMAVIGSPFEDARGNGSGAAYVFVREAGTRDSWVQVQKLIASNASSGDAFGHAVAIHGNVIAIGAPTGPGNGNSGLVYFFEHNSSSGLWTEVDRVFPADIASGDAFGCSVSLDAGRLLVGAHLDDDNGTSSGSAYLYEQDPQTNTWTLTQKLRASDAGAGAQFGSSVGLHEGTVVVGAPFARTNSVETGAAYVFLLPQSGTGNWDQAAKLTASDGMSADRFGFAVAVHGDAIAVGAPGHDVLGNETGTSYVFHQDQAEPSRWTQARKILPPDSLNNDQFGYSLSLSRDKLVVGMPFSGVDNQSKFGSVYAFVRDEPAAGQWGLVEKLLRGDPENNDEFGFAVSVHEDRVVIGSRMDDDLGTDSGSAYVYRLKFNNAPAVAIPIPSQVAVTNELFVFTLPAGTFADPDAGESLTLSATLQSGEPLPAWLFFEPVSGTFTGTPDSALTYVILVTATDEDGATASELFEIEVRDAQGSSTTFQQVVGEIILTIARQPGSSIMDISYQRYWNHDDTMYELLISGDLAGWTSAMPFVAGQTATRIDDDYGRFTYHVDLSLLRNKAHYFRLRVTPDTP